MTCTHSLLHVMTSCSVSLLQEIRVMYHIASEEFCQPKYHFARNCLYQFGEGNMSARNFILLTDVNAYVYIHMYTSCIQSSHNLGI